MWTVNANGYVKPETFISEESARTEIDKIFEIDRKEAAIQGDWSGIECDHVTLSKNDEVVAISGLIEVENGFGIYMKPLPA
jgi:hypothetical protein